MKKKIITVAVLLSVTASAYFLGTLHTGNRGISDKYISTTSKELYNNYVNMEQVTGFDINNGNLYLHFKSGEGYYLELDNSGLNNFGLDNSGLNNSELGNSGLNNNELNNNGQEDGITYED